MSGELSSDKSGRPFGKVAEEEQWRCGEFQRVTPATDTLFDLPSHMPRKGDCQIPFPFASARSALSLARSIHCLLAKLDAPGQQWTSQTANSKTARQICSRPPLAPILASPSSATLSHSPPLPQRTAPIFLSLSNPARPEASRSRPPSQAYLTFSPVALIGKGVSREGPNARVNRPPHHHHHPRAATHAWCRPPSQPRDRMVGGRRER